MNKLPKWVWVALKQHLEMSEPINLLVQQQLQSGSILRIIIERSVIVVLIWLGSIIILTILSYGLRFSNELVKKVRYFIIGIPRIVFCLMAALIKFIQKLF